MIQSHVLDSARLEVWGMLCDLERSIRYYMTLGDRYTLRYRGLRYVLLLLCIGECAAIGAALVWPVAALVFGGVLALLLAVLTVLDSVTSYGEAGAKLRVASHICSDLQSVCQSLWLDVETYQVFEADARRRLEEIDAHWTRACLRVSVEIHHHDNLAAALAAHSVVADRYRGRVVVSC